MATEATTAPSEGRATINVEGMTCQNCVRHVRDALMHLPGVKSADVNLAGKVAHVTFDAAQTGAPGLTGAVNGAGYKAAGIKIEKA